MSADACKRSTKNEELIKITLAVLLTPERLNGVKAREDIFGLVQMHADALAQRDEAMKNLRESSGQLAIVREQLYDMDLTARGNKREVDRLRGLLDRRTEINCR